MNLEISLVWPEAPSPEPFSGSVRILVIMTVAGLIVGLLHHFVEAEEVNVFGAIVRGRLDPRPVPGAILVALTLLIGGFPRTQGAYRYVSRGLVTWLSEQRKLATEIQRSNV